MRLVTVVLVLLPGVGSGWCWSSAAALNDAAAAGGDLHGQGQGAAGAAGAAQVTVRAALLVCSVPTLLVALTRSGRPGVGQGDVGGCARPGVVEGDDVAEGLAHGAALTLAVLVMRRSALSMRLVTVVLVLLPGVGSGVVLVSAAALVMLLLPVETCNGQGVRCRQRRWRLPGSRSGPRCWFAVCAHAVGGADQGSADRASVR